MATARQALLVLLALAGCAPAATNWYRSDASTAETSRALSECRREAAARAEDDFDRRTGYMDPTIDRGSDISTRFIVHDAKVRESRLVRECMTGRGFAPGRPASETR